MMDLIEVLSNLQSSGSGTGVSYYMTRCGAQAYLDKKHPRESSFNAAVGTVIHKLLELYYSRQLESIAIPLDDHADFAHDPVQEALRAFSAYVKYFPPDEFDVLATEQLLPEKDTAGNLTELGKAQAAVLGDLLVDPFTFRADMVVRFSQEQADNYYTRRRITVQPGVYLMDHKSHERAEAHGLRRYARAPQMIAYPHAYNALVRAGLMSKGAQEAQGMLVNNLIRHSEMSPEPTGRRQTSSFPVWMLDLASDVQLEAVRQFFRRQKVVLEKGEPNLASCDDWSGCAHYETGACDRVTIQGPLSAQFNDRRPEWYGP